MGVGQKQVGKEGQATGNRRARPVAMAFTEVWKLTCPWKLSSAVHQPPTIRLRRKL